MNELFSKLFDAVSEGLKLARAKDAHQYQDQWVAINLEIVAEKKKGYWRDDAKIEDCYKRLGVIADAAKEEIARATAAAAAQ